MQPRERRGTQRGERGSRGTRRSEQQSQRPACRERRWRLRVEVERVEEERRPCCREPCHQGDGLVSRELQSQAPADERRRRGQQGHEQHAARPPQGRVGGRQQQGQARAVGRKRPSVGPRPAPVRPERARHELSPLLAVVLVAQVQVVITPQALGHHQVVRLVARDLKPGGVAQPDAGVECPGREQQQPRRRPREGDRPSGPTALEDAHQGEERGNGDENERCGATEKPQARQALHQRVDPGHADR